MSKVAIMTDTVSYIPQELADEYSIKIVPMHVIIEGKDYAENEVNLVEYYKNFPQWKKEEKLPTTSGVPLGAFLEAYRELSKKAEAIVYIGHSKKLGMKVNTAEQAKQQIIALVSLRSAWDSHLLRPLMLAHFSLTQRLVHMPLQWYDSEPCEWFASIQWHMGKEGNHG